jgi:hypothetical protein
MLSVMQLLFGSRLTAATIGENVSVMIPSLYGVVTSFSYPPIRDVLVSMGIERTQDGQ